MSTTALKQPEIVSLNIVEEDSIEKELFKLENAGVNRRSSRKNLLILFISYILTLTFIILLVF
jgi:hypothetical protein